MMWITVQCGVARQTDGARYEVSGEDAKKMESMQGRLLAAQQKFMEAAGTMHDAVLH